MKILKQASTKEKLRHTAENLLNEEMIKGVVDVRKGLLAVDAEMHADLEKFLLENGSAQEDLWGINLWLNEEELEDYLEFDSMINIRPRQNNHGRSVENPEIREQIARIVEKWVK